MKIKTAALLLLSYFIARLPFLPLILRGEEGIFADIFLNHPQGPLYQQMGRINGENLYTLIEHPALIYETLAAAGGFWQLFVNPVSFGEMGLTIFLRFAFACFEWIVWGLLFFCLSQIGPVWKDRRQERAFLLALLLSMIWPGSLLNTTNINIDATVAVLAAGSVCAAVLLFRNPALPRIPLFLFLFLASFFSGFGKNELSLVYMLALGAIAVAVVLGRLFGSFRDVREPLLILLVAALANLAGNLFNYSFDPINYQAGWGILQSRSSQASLFVTRDVVAWLKMTLERLPFLFIHLLYWIVLVYALWRRRRELDFQLLFYFVYASALFFGFFFSYSEVGSRYFEPSFIVLVFGFVVAFPVLDIPVSFRRTFLVLAVLIAIHSSAEIITTIVRQVQNPTLRQTRFVLPEEVVQTGCMPILEQADAFNRPEIDYVVGPEFARQVETAGKTLCSKPYNNR